MIGGARVGNNFGFKRTLPYYTRFDTSPIANGFVPTSFMTGIYPDAFMFMSQEARFGDINKALSTSITGAHNRECVKNLESLIVNNLWQCAKGTKIVQFLYGGNGYDVRRTESVNIPTIMLSDVALKEQYHASTDMFDKQFHNGNVQKLLDEEFDQIKSDRDYYREMSMYVESSYVSVPVSGKFQSAVNVKRVVDDLIYEFREHKTQPIDPVAAINDINTFIKKLPYIFVNSIQEQIGSPIPERYVVSLRVTTILLRCYMNTTFMVRNKISNSMLTLMMDKVRFNIRKSLVLWHSRGHKRCTVYMRTFESRHHLISP
jgi:hypothetical protein